LEAEPVLRGRKIVLQSKDGHALWVSHAVIKGLGELPESYEAGYITRDSQGKPAGLLSHVD
jgi:predicted amidohydrolase YtcJ